MESKASKILRKGRQLLDPIMEKHGFHWEPGKAVKGSGGYADSGQYVKGNRKLELHFRYSLGLVTYHIGNKSLSHESYMQYSVGKGKAQYPGFSSDPLDGFRHLAHDLQKYGDDFLSGSGEKFQKAAANAREKEQSTGFKKLSSN